MKRVVHCTAVDRQYRCVTSAVEALKAVIATAQLACAQAALSIHSHQLQRHYCAVCIEYSICHDKPDVQCSNHAIAYHHTDTSRDKNADKYSKLTAFWPPFFLPPPPTSFLCSASNSAFGSVASTRNCLICVFSGASAGSKI